MKWIVIGIVLAAIFYITYRISKKLDKIEEANSKIYRDKKKVSDMRRTTGGTWNTRKIY